MLMASPVVDRGNFAIIAILSHLRIFLINGLAFDRDSFFLLFNLVVVFSDHVFIVFTLCLTVLGLNRRGICCGLSCVILAMITFL